MMDPKRALTNGVFCPMPWKGLMYNFDGKVKNCIRSAGSIGDLKENNIEEILHGDININTQECMLDDQPGPDCHTCYDLEKGKNNFDIVSDRIFYLRELKAEKLESYSVSNFDLKSIDVRWTNLCNFACVYCDEQFSSKWEHEKGIRLPKPSKQQVEDFKNFIFSNAHQLKHVYMAGGEPLLMKENLELLDILQQQNADVNLRINTNLSKTDTKVFEKICQFKNVHWTISVESMEEEFEYIRHGGKWADFLENLETVRSTGHKITFNMLHFILNYSSFFDTVDFLTKKGYHANSFVAGLLIGPHYLNIRHLPDNVLECVKIELRNRINLKPGYLLEESYKNILRDIDQPFEKNLENSLSKLRVLDQRRNLDSRKTFRDLYNLANIIYQGNDT